MNRIALSLMLACLLLSACGGEVNSLDFVAQDGTSVSIVPVSKYFKYDEAENMFRGSSFELCGDGAKYCAEGGYGDCFCGVAYDGTNCSCGDSSCRVMFVQCYARAYASE